MLSNIINQILSSNALTQSFLFVFTAVISAVIGLFVSRLWGRDVDNIIIKTFGSKIKKEKNLTGVWVTHYKYPSSDKDGDIDIEKQLVKLIQRGTTVTGETIYAQKHPEIFEGTVKDRYFTGVYVNKKDEHNYHGAFQYVLSNSENKMEGLWIGFNRAGNKIIYGEWRWIQKTPNIKLQKDLLDEYINETLSRNLFEEKFIL